MRFWEIEGHDPRGRPLGWLLLEGSFNAETRVTGESGGSFGTILTLNRAYTEAMADETDKGETTFSPTRYFVAKIPGIVGKIDAHAIRNKIEAFPNGTNETCKYDDHHFVMRHFDLRICCGLPVALSRKWDRTLQDLIAGKGANVAESLSIVIQLAHALAYCSGKGLAAYQDMKPENVLSDRIELEASPLEHRIKIIDFGFANALSGFGSPFGSRPYMAPEQYQQRPSTLAKADVFALGVILYELLTGGLHPIGEITRDVWPVPLSSKGKKWGQERIWRKWAENPSVADPDRVGPTALLRIIEKCLEPDIAGRYSAAALEHALLETLRTCDRNVYQSLGLILSSFDESASNEEAGGWPYSERLPCERNETHFS